MKTYILISAFLVCGALNAQTYDYQWAVRGGSTSYIEGSPPYYTFTQLERVNAVTVDAANNYYFLAEIGKNAASFGNTPITTYNDIYGRDIYVVSTDCAGNFRWQKTIGTYHDEFARGLGADTLGGVYVAGRTNGASNGENLYFDTDSIVTTTLYYNAPGPHNKTNFLIKYDTQGNFVWLRQPQRNDGTFFGDNYATGHSMEIVVEPDGTIHWLASLGPGTHVDGQVVVPSNIVRQWMILKYDKDGNFLNHIPLTMETYNLYRVQFHYDRINSRYYIGDYYYSGAPPPTFNNVPVTEGFYLIALDAAGNELWRREDVQSPGSSAGAAVLDIKTDAQGNVHLTGASFNFNSATGGTNDGLSFAGYMFDQINSVGGGTNAPYLIKLNSSGNLIWGTNPDTGSGLPGRSISTYQNEVVLGLGLVPNTWDGVLLDRPFGTGAEAVVVRFNATTGVAIAIHDILGPGGYEDEITALATDNYGNYIAGGTMKGSLFINDPLIPQINVVGGASDFFVAQLARTDCNGVPLGIEQAEARTSLQVYPNPATDRLYITGDRVWQSYTLYSVTGQWVSNGVLEPETQQQIGVSGLSAGLYLLKLTDKQGVEQTLRVVVE